MEGALKCPDPDCKRIYSDVDIFGNVTEPMFQKYVATKTKLKEYEDSMKMETEAKTMLNDELNRLASLDPTSREIEVRRRDIIENVLNVKCPRCGQVFADFAGCFALLCTRCRCSFCAWCLKDCNDNAHAHVSSCASNQTPDKAVYGDISVWREAENRKIKKAVEDRLNFVKSREIRQAVLKSITAELKDLGVEVTLRN
jgi:hypothetical protein